MIEQAIAGSKAVALARTSLSDARIDLDDAVIAMSNSTDEKVMASAKVVDLLFRVVAARRHLEKLERSDGRDSRSTDSGAAPSSPAG